MKINATVISERIEQFFSEKVEQLARQTRFVQRRSKLTGRKFLQAIVLSMIENPKMSLSSLSQNCLDLDVDISEQGLDERINERSVAFMRRMASEALEVFRQSTPLPLAVLQQFTGVYLVDSSQICLPETMRELFPGSGGNASRASLKIQLVFEYLHGQFDKLELRSGKEPDQGYRGHWSCFQAGALILMDLGYYVLDTLQQIRECDAFFLSRFQAQTALMQPDGTRIVLAELLRKQDLPLAEYEVRIGSRDQHQIPCRLIVVCLPQEAADRQRQKAKANAKRHGRTVSKEWLDLLDWACFVTNAPASMLQADHVPTLYRIRWQIELVFKMCKSFCGLDCITSQRPERVLTEFYARLIGILMTYFLIAPVRLPIATDPRGEISPTKVRQIFQRFARTIAKTLHLGRCLCDTIQELFLHITRKGFKQKRRKSPNALSLLALISACYDGNFDLNADDDDFALPDPLVLA